MGSAVYFSRRVFTENLRQKRRHFKPPSAPLCVFELGHICVQRDRALKPAHKRTTVLEPCNNSGKEGLFFSGSVPSFHSELTLNCLVYSTKRLLSALTVLS